LLGGLAGAAGVAIAGLPGQGAGQTPVAEPAFPASGLLVFPRHGTRTASPGTEISFRGEAIADIGTVIAIGSISGSHSGVLIDHSDGLGASFVPDSPFQPDEWVTVRADIPLRPTPSGSVTFRVSIPGVPVKTPAEREVDQPTHPPQEFRSRLDLLPPVVTITDSSNEVAPGYVFVGAKVADGQTGAMIVDNRGELIWFSPLDLDVAAHNDVRAQQYRGETVLTTWEGIARQGTGFGHILLLNQQYEEVARVQVGNGYPGIDQHESLLTERGTVLAIIYNPVRWDLSPAGGSADGTALDGVVQEIDIATGRVMFEWHSLDHIALEESYGVPTDEEPWDYVHVNSVELDAEDNFILSARHTNAVYRVERATGRVLWRLNGKRSDFKMGEGTPFAYQHDARVHANGELSLFDNAESDQSADDTAWSRGLVLLLDEEGQTATVAREYVHPTEVLSVSQGNMQLLPNGNAFVGWGSAPVFSEFDAEGNLLFNGRFPQGTNSYRAYRCEWEGRPSTPPDIAVEPGLGNNVTIYASWNGATEVRSWSVLTGTGADALEPTSSSQRTGFETTIRAEIPGSFVAVAALDADGEELGRSAAIHLR
jgi:hypothetical protein